MPTTDEIRACIEHITDPDLEATLGTLQAVHSVEVEGSNVKVFLEILPPLQLVARELDLACKTAIQERFPDLDVEVMVRELESPLTKRAAGIQQVKTLVAIASGKGGVGKSTVSANLAAALAQRGIRVGLLDADIYGPSQPTMYGVAGETMRAERTEDGAMRGYPIERYGVKVASIGFVMQRDQAAILRGPMLAGYFSTLVDQIQWGELDVLLFDLPPGTGDIQLTLTQRIPLTGAVVVTTPQEIALADVRRSIQMFRKVNVPVLGVIENMSYFIPPDMPDKQYYIFGQGGGERVASEYSVPFFGEVPIDMRIREGADEGFPFVLDPESGAAGDAFRALAGRVVREIRQQNHRTRGAALAIEL